MTLGPDRNTVSRWIRSEVAAGRVPRIRGGEEQKTDPPKNEEQKGEQKTEEKKADPPKDDGKKPKAKTVEIEGQVFVLQDDVNALVGEARQDGKTAGKKEVEDELRNKQLQEQGNFQQLYEAAQNKIGELEGQIATLQMKDLKRTIGAKHGLSQKLIDRLSGSNEAEIEADAKDLAKEFGTTEEKKEEKRKPIRTEGGENRNRSSNNGSERKPDEETRKRQRNYGFVQQGDINRWGE